jgi:UDP-N-acetyl-D-mannosaminouronate:lipid I N-acetyl-D-mannosaminouronosyltransferase
MASLSKNQTKMNYTNINGIQVFNFSSRSQLIEFAYKYKKILIAINAEKIIHATDQTRDLINRNIGYADGIGAVWALKKKGFKEVVKIPGCELWLDITGQFYLNKTFYLVGATEEVLQQAIKKLKKDFPGINIVGARNGYIKTDEERKMLIDTVVYKKPDIVFVAMGSPKQELLMQEMQQQHKAIYQGLGGSLDLYVGDLERAPEWWVKNNLEWAYRLVKQPSRIKRQIHLIRFLWLLMWNRI